MPADRTVRLRVICSPMPEGEFGAYDAIEMGIQHKQEVHPGEPHPNGGLRFQCDARVRPQAETGAPNFLGPHIFGTPGERFLYLVWTGYSAGEAERFSRMKIHLSAITWEQIEAAEQDGGVLEATVSGVGRNGAPAAASVPLEGGGWRVVSA